MNEIKPLKELVKFLDAIKVVDIDTKDKDYITFNFDWYLNEFDYKKFEKAVKEEEESFAAKFPDRRTPILTKLEKSLMEKIGNLVLKSDVFLKFCDEKGIYYSKQVVPFNDFMVNKKGGWILVEKHTLIRTLYPEAV